MSFLKKRNNAVLSFDFHSHLLPDMDDGCQSVEESIALLRESYARGIKTIVATPHFYPGSEDPESFLARRDRALEKLRSAIKEAQITDIPSVALGAEVAYFNGLSRCASLDKLCILGTNVMLVELPFGAWSDSVINDIELFGAVGFVPLIAHIERYIGYQSSTVAKHMCASELLIQANAESFLSMRTRGMVLKGLREGWIDVLGSDSHGTQKRSQNIDEASAVICSRLGAGAVEELEKFSQKLLESAKFVI